MMPNKMPPTHEAEDDPIERLLGEVARGVRTKGGEWALQGLRMQVAEMRREVERARLIEASFDAISGREGALDYIREVEQARAEGMARGMAFRELEKRAEERSAMIAAFRAMAKAAGVSEEKRPCSVFVRYSSKYTDLSGLKEYDSDLDLLMARFAREDDVAEGIEQVTEAVTEALTDQQETIEALEKTNAEQTEELEAWRNTDPAAEKLASLVLDAIGAETFDEDLDLYQIRRAAEDVLGTHRGTETELEKLTARLAELRGESDDRREGSR